MRIGVIRPNRGFLTGGRTMHRWAEEFLKHYTDRVLTYEEAKTYDGDAVICLNGRPDIPKNHPPKEFKGLKAVHLMDHVFQTERTRKVLLENNIQYVMGYNSHDLYDDFFKHHFKEWDGKVIPVPFGYNDIRFSDQKSWNERENKVIALGSVNPVADRLCIHDLAKYKEFYKNEKFTHKWRRMLWENKSMLIGQMDSLLPEYPKTKDFDYNIVQKYNDYKMFTSGESILNYPSVKTFEGMACGSVLVCSDHPCYKDLGLVDGVNCIMHKQYDIDDFQRKVFHYQSNEDELKRIAENGKKFVEEFYNPSRIAQNLFFKLTRCK